MKHGPGFIDGLLELVLGILYGEKTNVIYKTVLKNLMQECKRAEISALRSI